MRRAALLLLFAGAAWADTSGLPKSPLTAERLGNVYTYDRNENDRGLDVEVWHNDTLQRDEVWYKPSRQEHFLRVNETTYVRGRHAGGEWRTDPSLCIVYREGSWRRDSFRATAR